LGIQVDLLSFVIKHILICLTDTLLYFFVGDLTRASANLSRFRASARIDLSDDAGPRVLSRGWSEQQTNHIAYAQTK
jgi:hypothetical protein